MKNEQNSAPDPDPVAGTATETPSDQADREQAADTYTGPDADEFAEGQAPSTTADETDDPTTSGGPAGGGFDLIEQQDNDQDPTPKPGEPGYGA